MLHRTLFFGFWFAAALVAADADLIFHNGRILTVDAKFSVAQAIAIKNGRITAIGSDKDVVPKERGSRTRVVDLGGKTALPGLIDAHVHALGAALSEYRSKLPPLGSIVEIQNYIRERAKVTPKGEWIVVPRTLPPRLKEMRMPTRQDLDVTPDHPVAFDGSYVWSANTMALRVSGITRSTPNPPGGEVVKDEKGEPNGILRNAASLLKGAQRAETFTEKEEIDALKKMLDMYAAAGLTAVGDRAVGPKDVAIFEKLHAAKQLPVRTVLTWRINASPPIEQIEKEINASKWKTGVGDDWLRFGTFKVTLDGGQSVGTAYQRIPYGPFGRQLYGQTNPDARGTLFVEPDKLYRIYKAARAKGWQLTAHAQGGAAIDTLLNVFERLDKDKPIRGERHHVMHGSFMSEEAVQKMKRLGVGVDAQPGWVYLDVPALQRVFGLQNMKWFFPLKSFLAEGIPVAGGTDHMIGYGKDNAVNPYNPFLNIWACVTRKTTEGKVFNPEQQISREDALRMYTNGAAWVHFTEKDNGSLEVGKFGDLVVIDRDLLKVPVDEIKEIQPLMTVIDGRIVYDKK